MVPAVCIVPVAPVRSAPSHDAEMTSQLLFGEACTVHGPAVNGAFRVRCSLDGYEGYCMGNQLLRVGEPGESKVFRHWSNTVTCPDGSSMQVPFGASFPEALVGTFRVQDPEVLSAGKIPLPFSLSLYLNTSYQWGGRSVFGADCSGFTQTVMKAAGMRIPRDASQQVECGVEIGFDEIREGDLAFFDLEGKVVHVGICIGGGEIMHAFGKVRMDRLDERGIYDPATGVYSHSLCKLKRLL